MNVQQRLRPSRGCRCARSRGDPSAIDGGGTYRGDPRDPRLTDMRWSSVTGAAVHTIAESVRMRRSLRDARNDANLTQVTEGRWRRATGGLARLTSARKLSEQTSVRALSRTDADAQMRLQIFNELSLLVCGETKGCEPGCSAPRRRRAWPRCHRASTAGAATAHAEALCGRPCLRARRIRSVDASVRRRVQCPAVLIGAPRQRGGSRTTDQTLCVLGQRWRHRSFGREVEGAGRLCW